MALTDLLIRGSSVAVVVFVVSSTLSVGLSLTVGQILAPLKNARLVVLSLAANFVLAPLVALGLWRVLGLDEPLGIGLLLCGLAAGAPHRDGLLTAAAGVLLAGHRPGVGQRDAGDDVAVVVVVVIGPVAYRICLNCSRITPVSVGSSLSVSGILSRPGTT